MTKVLDTKERSRARKMDMGKKKTTQSAALDELKKKREEKAAKTEEQQRREGLDGKKKWKANDIYSSDSSDSDIDKKERSPERSRRRSSSSSSSSSTSSRSRSRSTSPRHRAETVKNKDDLERARLSRNQLEKWIHLPDFSKVISGCFVRIGIGQHEGESVYRVAEILEACDTTKIYNV